MQKLAKSRELDPLHYSQVFFGIFTEPYSSQVPL